MRTPQNLHQHELLGLECKVAKSVCKTYVGLCGIVVGETKNTLVLETKSGEKAVPKRECGFTFLLGGRRVAIDGWRLAFRPEDRTKKSK